MADKEFSNDSGEGTLSSSGSKQHGLPGFSSNENWDKLQETGLWSHYPTQPGAKAGFHDPVAPAPARQQLTAAGDGNVQADAPAAEWPAADSTTPATLGQKGIPDGMGGNADGAFSAGRHDGTERGNSPWFRGGPH